MYRNKYLKYRNKYLKLLTGGAEANSPTSRHLEIPVSTELATNLEKLTIYKEQCNYINLTNSSKLENMMDNKVFFETLKIVENINIKDYKYLLIIIGGRCKNIKNMDCFGYRTLNTLVDKAKEGNKILTLIIDPFICSVEDEAVGTVECYNPIIQTLDENENIFIQHIKLGLNTNKNCIFNIYLNNFVNYISENGFVIIVNAAIYINPLPYHELSLKKSVEFLNGIFIDSILYKPNILIYMHNILDSYFSQILPIYIFQYLMQLNRIIQNFKPNDYNIIEYVFKYLGLDSSKKEDRKKIITTYYEKGRISSSQLLNFILNDKINN